MPCVASSVDAAAAVCVDASRRGGFANHSVANSNGRSSASSIRFPNTNTRVTDSVHPVPSCTRPTVIDAAASAPVPPQSRAEFIGTAHTCLCGSVGCCLCGIVPRQMPEASHRFLRCRRCRRRVLLARSIDRRPEQLEQRLVPPTCHGRCRRDATRSSACGNQPRQRRRDCTCSFEGPQVPWSPNMPNARQCSTCVWVALWSRRPKRKQTLQPTRPCFHNFGHYINCRLLLPCFLPEHHATV